MTSAKTISNGMTDQSLLKLLRCSPFFAKVLISNRFFVPLQRILTKVDYCRLGHQSASTLRFHMAAQRARAIAKKV